MHTRAVRPTPQRHATQTQRTIPSVRRRWFWGVVVFGVLGFGFISLRSGIARAPADVTGTAAPAVHSVVRLPVISDRPRVTFLVVGDIMLSRAVAAISKRENDRAYPFREISAYLRSADFVFANLETPITSGREIRDDELIFRSDPGVEQDLAEANVRVVSLANNHVPNFGEKGILDTLSLLHAAGIQTTGAGKDHNEALQPAVITKNGVRIAFLAYNDTDVVPDSYGATAQRAGTALMDIPTMQEAVGAARRTADIVVVSMHAGIEYSPRPNTPQQRFARAAIDAGAHLVLGHHPHVVQPVERYQGKYILYSLGNFIFDQPFSEETKTGMTAVVTVSDRGVEHIAFQPISIEHASQPRLLAWPDAHGMAERLTVPLDALGNILPRADPVPPAF